MDREEEEKDRKTAHHEKNNLMANRKSEEEDWDRGLCRSEWGGMPRPPVTGGAHERANQVQRRARKQRRCW